METNRPPDSDSRVRTDVATNSTRPRVALVAGVLLVALAIALGIVIKFPNLNDTVGYLALAVATPILGGFTLAFWRPVLGRKIPTALTVALRTALAAVVLLDLGFFVLVGFIRTEANDTAPAFITRVPTTTTETTATPQPTEPPQFTGVFDSRQGLDTASGNVILGTTAGGLYVLRLQHFATSHGPDLYLYLSKVAVPTTSAQVMDGLEVSALKATSGNQNYTLPAGIDVTVYKSVVVYCKSFSAIFGYATLI